MKNRPVGAELFHADGRTDMTKLIVAFAKAPKKMDGLQKISGYLLGEKYFNWCCD